jgi:rhodanese-related sulfurtransferase
MRFQQIVVVFIFFSLVSCAQSSIDAALKLHNSETVPYIYVEELHRKLQLKDHKIKLLDARELEEFNVSHLAEATHVGYQDFNLAEVLEHRSLNTSDTIVVYCSIGVRSEDIGEQFLEAGFKQVYNLYGGIFTWTNQSYPVYVEGEETQRVHPYNKFWGQFLAKAQKSEH